VYVGSGDNGESGLWLRSLASTTVQLLAGTEMAFNPFWSPDSRSNDFLTGSSLRRFDIGGVDCALDLSVISHTTHEPAGGNGLPPAGGG